MIEDRNSYKSITKSIGIFGGTKVFQILVGLVQNKLVAILLGPVGMGVQGMFMSTINLIQSLTGLGLHTSAVRDVAKAHTSQDIDRISTTVGILRMLVIITGIFGSLLVIVFAQPLSIWSFGNGSYENEFRFLAIVLFLNQVVVGQTVLLQGTFHYKHMAIASLLGSVLSLIFSTPLYYIWGESAIVPVIIIVSLVNLIITSIYARKVTFTRKRISLTEVWSGGKVMITLGVALALSSVVGTGKIYLIRAFLSNYGSLEAVGLYTAGSSIVTQYINVIFQAMGSDYSPRLASVSDNPETFIALINKQAVLLITLISPIVLLFIVLAPQVILLLFTSKFLPIIGMIQWMMAGMLFRAISWAMSYSFAARGDSKVFFLNELLTGIWSFVLTIFGYLYYGYTGIGVAFCATYVIYSLQVFVISKIRFAFYFNSEAKRLCFPFLLLTFLMSSCVILTQTIMIKMLIGIISLLITSYLSYKRLDQMIGLDLIFSSIKYRLHKK